MSIAAPSYRAGGYTIDDWFDTCEANPEATVQLVEGNLIFMPPPGAGHQQIIVDLILWLVGWQLRDGGRGQVLPGLGVKISDTTGLIPDLIVLYDKPPNATVHTLDASLVRLAVEVESPSSKSYDRLYKPRLYAKAGIAHYWRIFGADHPETAAIECSVLREGHYHRTFLGHVADLLVDPPVFHDEEETR